jgi:hypothetical protein
MPAAHAMIDEICIAGFQAGRVGMRWTGRTLKTGLLFGWALWLSLVTLTNILDALKALDVLGDDFSFASGNWPYLQGTTAIHDVPTWMNALLFGGVIGWELIGSALFWLAWTAYRRGAHPASESVMAAYIVSAALWVAFTIADELFFVFDTENTHRLLLVALLASVVTMFVVPDGEEPGPVDLAA